jgi:hypothetical protein
MYLRNKGNISLNKTRKLKRRRQNGGARGARHDTRDTIRSLMKRIATTISPPSVSLFTRKRSKASSKASSKVSPDVSDVPKQEQNSVSRKAKSAKSAKSTTLDEDTRNALALAERAKLEYAMKAADTEETVKNTNDLVRSIFGETAIINYTQSPVEDAVLQAELDALTNPVPQQSTGITDEEMYEELAELAELEKEDGKKDGKKGGKKSRTRRRHKKSRKYY